MRKFYARTFIWRTIGKIRELPWNYRAESWLPTFRNVLLGCLPKSNSVIYLTFLRDREISCRLLVQHKKKTSTLSKLLSFSENKWTFLNSVLSILVDIQHYHSTSTMQFLILWLNFQNFFLFVKKFYFIIRKYFVLTLLS